ncbi:MAG: homocysteine S-methyltransferase family protein [Actinomycetota bacterium]
MTTIDSHCQRCAGGIDDTTRPRITHMADGGLETTLLFLHGLDLPDFAAFPLLDSDKGRAELRAYYTPYLQLAAERGLAMVLDTPTWRASADWGIRLGYDRNELAALNRRAVVFIRNLAADVAPTVDVVLNGAIGPRGDGYVVGEVMSIDEAASYHSLQARAFAEANIDTITAVTMTYVAEAIGVARAAMNAGVAVTIGFTVETDGHLPSGTPLGEAIAAVDAATGGVAGYMVNCAHPSHVESVLAAGDEAWLSRIVAVRANASRMSHEELDNAPELDRGDPEVLAADYATLGDLLPNLSTVGGCCGTDSEHIAVITAALTAA